MQSLITRHPSYENSLQHSISSGKMTPTVEYKDENAPSSNTPSTMHSTLSSLNEESWVKHANNNNHNSSNNKAIMNYHHPPPNLVHIPVLEHNVPHPLASNNKVPSESNISFHQALRNSDVPQDRNIIPIKMPWSEAASFTRLPSSNGFQGHLKHQMSLPNTMTSSSRTSSPWNTVVSRNSTEPIHRQHSTSTYRPQNSTSNLRTSNPSHSHSNNSNTNSNSYASIAHQQSNSNHHRPHSNSITSQDYHHHKSHIGQTSGSSHGSRGVKTNGMKNTFNSSRSAPDVLKTLLRKKACLYEAGTSRAVALITWLVGRKLTLEQGYFSRQLLQSGVHSVVAQKIDSGLVTRTKVNRCMQIILNSCFHYIIPRPDGTEENGSFFREIFREQVDDDTHLINYLESPWDNLDINLADGAMEEHQDDDESSEDGSSKRLVLLCFNENVRSAEDVLRCHNDFIRDAAISANLCLSAEDWRNFFSRRDEDCSFTSSTLESSSSVPNSPILRGNEGYEIPYLSFDIPSEVSECIDSKSGAVPWSKNSDILGQMTSNELNKFRTTWCCKRYDHNERLCRFAHSDINKGWLRRDPSKFQYSGKMCHHVFSIRSEGSTLEQCDVNSCKDGLLCKFAHSNEEVLYHPMIYKTSPCNHKAIICQCDMLDICPYLHDNKAFQTSVARNSSKAEQRVKSIGSKGTSAPNGSPILYLNPAPPSEFERNLCFPGLRALYRSNCAANYAYNKKSNIPTYNLF